MGGVRGLGGGVRGSGGQGVARGQGGWVVRVMGVGVVGQGGDVGSLGGHQVGGRVGQLRPPRPLTFHPKPPHFRPDTHKQPLHSNPGSHPVSLTPHVKICLNEVNFYVTCDGH